jgi:hypothetical protein
MASIARFENRKVKAPLETSPGRDVRTFHAPLEAPRDCEDRGFCVSHWKMIRIIGLSIFNIYIYVSNYN